MDQTNEKIVEELAKDFEASLTSSDFREVEKNEVSADTDTTTTNHQPEFHDAVSNLSCDEDSDVSSNGSASCSSELENLTEDQVEERKKNAMELKDKGNELFRSGDHNEACKLYTKALKMCPKSLVFERSMLYNNRAAAKTKQGLKEGAVRDSTKAIDLNPPYVKALLRRAKLYEELEQLDKALEDYQELSKLEPNNPEVRAALTVLPKKIEEQTEKLKKEMFSKMKDFGNLLLRPFGLSTDNFELKQDPNTGSYSVNMTK